MHLSQPDRTTAAILGGLALSALKIALSFVALCLALALIGAASLFQG